jgi:hypothetical protein
VATIPATLAASTAVGKCPLLAWPSPGLRPDCGSRPRLTRSAPAVKRPKAPGHEGDSSGPSFGPLDSDSFGSTPHCSAFKSCSRLRVAIILESHVGTLNDHISVTISCNGCFRLLVGSALCLAIAGDHRGWPLPTLTAREFDAHSRFACHGRALMTWRARSASSVDTHGSGGAHLRALSSDRCVPDAQGCQRLIPDPSVPRPRTRGMSENRRNRPQPNSNVPKMFPFSVP